MDTEIFDQMIERKLNEVVNIYNLKSTKNKKMTKDPSELDYHSKKTLNLINAALDKKLKGSKAYQKNLEKMLS